jgi:hypothetical protein
MLAANYVIQYQECSGNGVPNGMVPAPGVVTEAVASAPAN